MLDKNKARKVQASSFTKVVTNRGTIKGAFIIANNEAGIVLATDTLKRICLNYENYGESWWIDDQSKVISSFS